MLSRVIGLLGRFARGGVLRARSPASSARILLPAAPGSEAGKGNRRLRAFKHLGSFATIATCSALLYISYQAPIDVPEGNNASEEETDQNNGASGGENVIDTTKDLFAVDKEMDASGEETDPQKNVASGGANDANRPEHIDWVEAGAVTPVMHQKLCGCCGCLASVGAVESVYKIKKGTLHTFSTQQLVDYDKNGGSCEGCYAYLNFLFMSMNGIVRSEDYPYKDEQGPCMSTEGMPTFKISGYVPVRSLDEEQLRIAVARQPVVMHVYPNEAFENFKGDGIIELEECPPVDNPDPERLHAVLVVAYGVAPDGRKWWKIKNSWGPTWGDGGYAKLRRDVSDPRGVASLTALPGLTPVID